MSTAVTPVPEQGVPLSQVERVTNVFFAPSKTFTDIKRNAKWWAPWLLMLVVSIPYARLVENKIGFEQIAQTNMRFVPKIAVDAMEQQRQANPAAFDKKQADSAKRSVYGFLLIRTCLWLIVALVLWLTFNFGFGAQTTYWQSSAVVIYSSLPIIVKTLLASVVLFAGVDPGGFLVDNPVGTNIGYFLSFADTPRFLYVIASQIDLITFWVLILGGIGFSSITSVKRGTAIAVTFGWYTVMSLLIAGIAAAFS
ncbi:MAG: hypothetical protein JWN45_1416 [Acidobacteriaceae bacterium]|nr:hypothetical protein [Acidobacteriaceae bacterium]